MSESLPHRPAKNQTQNGLVFWPGSHRDVIYKPDPDDPSEWDCDERLREAFDRWFDDPRSRALTDPLERLNAFMEYAGHLPKQYLLQESPCIESCVSEYLPTLDEWLRGMQRARLFHELGMPDPGLPQTGQGAGFPPPVPLSQLGDQPEDFRWIWPGILMAGAITLFSALWKIGKTTLIGHLIRALGVDDEFLGRRVRRCNVLYVTEEPKNLWIARRDQIGIGDHVQVIVQPFLATPSFSAWEEFVFYLRDQLDKLPSPSVLVLDTLSRFWPVLNENDAAEVNRAAAPLRALTQKSAVLLNHHIRKGDGQQATASRGSGALPAFADILLEMRRYDASTPACHKRVLTGYGRYPDFPEELVIELDDQGYRAVGDKQQVKANQIAETIAAILPREQPGATYEELVEQWTDDQVPRKATILKQLNAGSMNGAWQRTGEGKRGSPFQYFRP
jgi:hypothetical protein